MAKRNGSTPRSTQTRNYSWRSMSTAAAGQTPRRSRERDSRAAHQNTKCSEDGVSSPPHRETRRRRGGVSRRCWRLPDCPRSSRIERSAQLDSAEMAMLSRFIQVFNDGSISDNFIRGDGWVNGSVLDPSTGVVHSEERFVQKVIVPVSMLCWITMYTFTV